MSDVTTLGQINPGELFETLEPSHYGSRGVATHDGNADESGVIWCDPAGGFMGKCRWLPDSTPVRRVPWPSDAAAEVARLTAVVFAQARALTASEEAMIALMEGKP